MILQTVYMTHEETTELSPQELRHIYKIHMKPSQRTQLENIFATLEYNFLSLRDGLLRLSWTARNNLINQHTTASTEESSKINNRHLDIVNIFYDTGTGVRERDQAPRHAASTR
jgi:hypothetical protein